MVVFRDLVKNPHGGDSNSTRQFDVDLILVVTLPETNIAPARKPSEKETSLPSIHFQLRTVSFREGKLKSYFQRKIYPGNLWQDSHQFFNLAHRFQRGRLLPRSAKGEL